MPNVPALNYDAAHAPWLKQLTEILTNLHELGVPEVGPIMDAIGQSNLSLRASGLKSANERIRKLRKQFDMGPEPIIDYKARPGEPAIPGNMSSMTGAGVSGAERNRMIQTPQTMPSMNPAPLPTPGGTSMPPTSSRPSSLGVPSSVFGAPLNPIGTGGGYEWGTGGGYPAAEKTFYEAGGGATPIQSMPFTPTPMTPRGGGDPFAFPISRPWSGQLGF